MPYWKKNKDTNLVVFDDHVDNKQASKLDFQSWILYLPDDIGIRVYSGVAGKGTLEAEYGRKISLENPVVASLCMDYLDSVNPLATTTSWVNILRDGGKPIRFDGFDILRNYNINAFHIAECRRDLHRRGGPGATEELESLITEFNNMNSSKIETNLAPQKI